jgi:hypothetical protein
MQIMKKILIKKIMTLKKDIKMVDVREINMRMECHR